MGKWGYFVAEPELLDFIDSDKTSLEYDVLPKLAEKVNWQL